MGIGSFGFSEMAVVFLIALIVFGPRKLPELGRTMGAAMREFRRSLNQIQREIEEADPVRSMRDEARSILGPESKGRSEPDSGGSSPAGGAKPAGGRAGPRPTGARPRPSDAPAEAPSAGDSGSAARTDAETDAESEAGRAAD